MPAEARRLDDRRRWEEWPEHGKPKGGKRGRSSGEGHKGKWKEAGAPGLEPTAQPARPTAETLAEDMKQIRLDYTLASSFQPQRHMMVVLGRPVVALLLAAHDCGAVHELIHGVRFFPVNFPTSEIVARPCVSRLLTTMGPPVVLHHPKARLSVTTGPHSLQGSCFAPTTNVTGRCRGKIRASSWSPPHSFSALVCFCVFVSVLQEVSHAGMYPVIAVFVPSWLQWKKQSVQNAARSMHNSSWSPPHS